MHQGWLSSRTPDFADDVPEALGFALDAAAADPTWAVPARFVDEWHHRRNLTLPERYGEHMEAARRGNATAAYLAGRLGGEAADLRLDHARRLDPLLGWAWHGEAWRAFAAGRIHQATVSGTRAVAYAADPLELTHFSWALSRYLRADERAVAARDVLEDALLKEGPLALRPGERAMIEAELSLAEMESLEERAQRRGVQRALRLVADAPLQRSERAALALALAERGSDEVPAAVLELALFEANDAELLEAGARRGRRARLVRAFGAGLDGPAIKRAFDDWASSLPEVALDGEGRPKRKPLASVAAWVETHAGGKSLVTGEGLARALAEAGWYEEGLALVRALKAHTTPLGGLSIGDPDARFTQIEGECLRARALLAEIGALARRIDARKAFLRAGAVGDDDVTSEEAGMVSSLGGLTDELARLFGEDDAAEESTRVRYGPLGAVLHPGPTLSAEDARLDRGEEGAPVGGVAELFLRMGRFALIGHGVGQGGPDATVLRLVHIEQRAGEHLGRPFRGTVFWCDGADVPGRFGRLGSSISGAALHEGYYVDLDMVALEKAQWDAVRERFNSRSSWVQLALGARPAKTSTRVQRRETTPPLGAADRMRLAVMQDRGEGAQLAEVSLGELAGVVAVHEEGHLCDRAQWYPLSFGRVMSLISFAGAHGFSSTGIARALEARAQLVALSEADDVRLAWIDLLDAAEGEAGSVTPHARAYRGLLQDLVDRLDAEYEDGSWRDAGLDPEGRWIDQLHRVDPERLRALAVREAQARGLAR